jgi:hypothetical protein
MAGIEKVLQCMGTMETFGLWFQCCLALCRSSPLPLFDGSFDVDFDGTFNVQTGSIQLPTIPGRR